MRLGSSRFWPCWAAHWRAAAAWGHHEAGPGHQPQRPPAGAGEQAEVPRREVGEELEAAVGAPDPPHGGAAERDVHVVRGAPAGRSRPRPPRTRRRRRTRRGAARPPRPWRRRRRWRPRRSRPSATASFPTGTDHHETPNTMSTGSQPTEWSSRVSSTDRSEVVPRPPPPAARRPGRPWPGASRPTGRSREPHHRLGLGERIEVLEPAHPGAADEALDGQVALADLVLELLRRRRPCSTSPPSCRRTRSRARWRAARWARPTWTIEWTPAMPPDIEPDQLPGGRPGELVVGDAVAEHLDRAHGGDHRDRHEARLDQLGQALPGEEGGEGVGTAAAPPARRPPCPGCGTPRPRCRPGAACRRPRRSPRGRRATRPPPPCG